MNTLKLTLVVLLAAVAARAESKVARVVVFPDRAQVTRTTSIACGPKAAAEFAELPPSLDLRSLRAATTTGSIEGLEVQTRTREKALSAEAQALEKKLKGLQAQRRVIVDALNQAGLQRRSAGAFEGVASQLVSRELAMPAPDVKAWSGAFERAWETRARASKLELEQSVKLRELDRQIGEAEQRRNELGDGMRKQETYARVLVECASGQSAKVELGYLVGGAGWQPTYEVRADDEAGVELKLVARVSQRTGEAWTDAQLVLSTAVPRQDATPPELLPLRVYADKREPPKKVLVRRDEERKHAQAGAGDSGSVDAETQIDAQGLSVQLTAPGRADIPADGTGVDVEVATTKLKAAFAWKVMPSLLPYVVRVADIVNTAPFPLLPGEASLFRRGAFAAKNQLERIAEGARFQLAFGLEDGIQVKRHVLEEIKKDTGVFSKGKRFYFGYAFELVSGLSKPVEVTLSDRVPVSELDDVRVEIVEQTTAGYALEKEDGIVTWTRTLKPGAKERIELRFFVEVPSGYDTGGL